jgi:triacylglycerol esterase/lipase EstA (alpha/beta hydrolase family)
VIPVVTITNAHYRTHFNDKVDIFENVYVAIEVRSVMRNGDSDDWVTYE